MAASRGRPTVFPAWISVSGNGCVFDLLFIPCGADGWRFLMFMKIAHHSQAAPVAQAVVVVFNVVVVPAAGAFDALGY